MKIINLMEDTQGQQGYLFEHGLSFYIETEHHKILCDTGATAGFMENAREHGIDLNDVDTVVLSHGHYDHSGGLLAFAHLNSHAKIYIQKTASGDYYNYYGQIEKYIGIDKEILNLQNVVWLDGDCKIDEELEIFSGISGRRFWADSNRCLKEKVGNTFVQDEFVHEQCLVIHAEEKEILISGCAHNGVLNILDKYYELYKSYPTHMISGFHLMKKTPYDEKDEKVIQETAKELMKLNTKFYTGHCTGNEACGILKQLMGEQIEIIHSGDVLPDFCGKK